MQKVNKFNIGAMLAVAAMLSAPVAIYAEGGISGSGTSGSGSTSSGSGTSGSGEVHSSTSPSPAPSTSSRSETKSEPPQTETTHASGVETHHAADSNELHHQGDSLVSQLEKNHHDAKKRTPEEQKKVCEAHKDGLVNKFSHIVSNSDRVQTRIDDIFSKAIVYQAANNLQPVGFDTLVASAKTAQTNSAASIAALKAVKPSIDCNNVSVANDVATFKTAAAQTRDNLKAYKAAVKAVLQSLETVKSTTPEGSKQ